MPEKTVYVWKCSTHGEVELFTKQEKAFCPQCGKEMTYIDSYVERDTS
jgi:rRNA maturation endonuclease Nob1